MPLVQTDVLSALRGVNEIEITVTGQTSGRSLTYPVWFAVEGDKLSLIPVRGSDTEWYKNLRKQPSIRLSTRGKTFTTSARLLTDEAQLDQVLEKFRDEYGRNVKAYYPKYDVAIEVPLERGVRRAEEGCLHGTQVMSEAGTPTTNAEWAPCTLMPPAGARSRGCRERRAVMSNSLYSWAFWPPHYALVAQSVGLARECLLHVVETGA
jgi:deazaflavin-dependent oxidoreductase (nitroreductase family)